jgi:DNA-binding transcriptional LysR family regulator
VAEREHVTRAAEKLFVSQSAISRAVTQLEEEVWIDETERRTWFLSELKRGK